MVAANIPDLTCETPLQVSDVMKRFSVCRRTVENWFASGLEGMKLGGRVYTTVEAIQRFASPLEYGNRGQLANVLLKNADREEQELRELLGR